MHPRWGQGAAVCLSHGFPFEDSYTFATLGALKGVTFQNRSGKAEIWSTGHANLRNLVQINVGSNLRVMDSYHKFVSWNRTNIIGVLCWSN